jgi:hypothetical protein
MFLCLFIANRHSDSVWIFSLFLLDSKGTLKFSIIHNKYILIRRGTKPPPFGDELTEEMVDFYIELATLAFGVSINYFF